MIVWRRTVALFGVATSLAIAAPLVPAEAAPASVSLTGSVRTATGAVLVSARVAVENPATGAVVAATQTSSKGQFTLKVPPANWRLVIGSGSPDRRGAGLPQVFDWRGEVTITKTTSLPVRLPSVRSLSVLATDQVGAPLSGAAVTVPDPRGTLPAVLWPGGPPMVGTQQVSVKSSATGSSGRAVLAGFPTENVGTTQITYSPSTGISQSTTLGAQSLASDSFVVGIPSRPGCTPRAVPDFGGTAPVLVADLNGVTLGPSGSRSSLLAAANDIVSGAIPQVVYNTARTGDALRYLYDEGVALRRITGILAYAYAATNQDVFLDAMASRVALNAAAWPDWNPGHQLDTAQIATAVALAYRWSAGRMTTAQRSTVASALTTRMIMAYSCADGALGQAKSTTGNVNTVMATAATLTGLALRADRSGWASVGVADGTAALARLRLPTGIGASIADGPTVEGLMYSTYEAANLALLHATKWRNSGDASVTGVLAGSLADLGAFATWNERCGTVADPNLEDAHDYYPWVDRPTALAAMAAWPGAGGHVLDLVTALQARDTLTIPDRGVWTVPDGIAELILSGQTPTTTQPPSIQSFAPGDGGGAPFWGCASHGSMRAMMSGAPNNAPHSHKDVGNVFVADGSQTVLADFGQRDYNFNTQYVWRSLTRAHNVIGIEQPDGRVTQPAQASGRVSSTSDGLRMVSGSAVADASWTRTVALADGSVTIRDELDPTAAMATAKPLSSTFLLQTPPSQVNDLGAGRLQFSLANGTMWEMQAPAGMTVTVSDGQPVSPYDDTAEFKAGIGPLHTLVRLTTPWSSRLDVTTTFTRLPS